MILVTTVNEVAEDYRVIMTHDTHTHTHNQSNNQILVVQILAQTQGWFCIFLSLSLSLSLKEKIYISFISLCKVFLWLLFLTRQKKRRKFGLFVYLSLKSHSWHVLSQDGDIVCIPTPPTKNSWIDSKLFYHVMRYNLKASSM